MKKLPFYLFLILLVGVFAGFAFLHPEDAFVAALMGIVAMVITFMGHSILEID